jgi:Tfp pilus assembly protein PilN
MIRINLLKPEKKDVKLAPKTPEAAFKEKNTTPLYSLFILLAIAAIVVLFFFQKNNISEEQDLLEVAQQEKKSLQYISEKLQKLETQRDTLQNKIHLIDTLKSRQGNAVIIMDELSSNIPDWVWLTETSFSGNKIRIKGKAMSNNLLADYIRNLKESPYLTNIDLISSTLRNVKNSEYLEFSMTAELAPRHITLLQPETKGEEK